MAHPMTRPAQLSQIYLRRVLKERVWTAEEKLSALQSMFSLSFSYFAAWALSTGEFLSMRQPSYINVHSYFSSLFAATRTFPRHPGIASGLSMGLLGLSPLVFSLVAGNLFNGLSTIKKCLSDFSMSSTSCLI